MWKYGGSSNESSSGCFTSSGSPWSPTGRVSFQFVRSRKPTGESAFVGGSRPKEPPVALALVPSPLVPPEPAAFGVPPAAAPAAAPPLLLPADVIGLPPVI